MTAWTSAKEAFASLAERPCAVTIDLHRGHLDPEVATLPLPAERAAALIQRVVPLLDAFRELGLPVIHVVTSYRSKEEILSNPYWRFQSGRPGSARAQIAEHNLEGLPGLELMPGIARSQDLIITTKKRYDCFIGTDLEFVLRSGGHDSILLMGVNTNSCVVATAIAASVRDFAVFTLEEGVDTMLGPELHAAAIQVLEASFGWRIDGPTVLEILRSRIGGGGARQ